MNGRERGALHILAGDVVEFAGPKRAGYPTGEAPAFRRELLQNEARNVPSNNPGADAPLLPLYQFVSEAEKQLGNDSIFYAFIRDPNRTNALVETYRRRDDRIE